MSFRKPHDWVGPTPWEEIKEAFEDLLPHAMYSMELKTPGDVAAVQWAWNQGIDSRLEGITRPCKAQWLDKERSQLRLTFDISGLLVFIRRLYEAGDAESLDLRSAVLQSLGIEEV